MITKVITTKDSEGRYKTFKKQFNNEWHIENYCRVVEENGTKIIGVEDPKVSDVDRWKANVDTHLSRLEDIFNELPDKGYTYEDSQKLSLSIALQKLWSTVNETTKDDLISEN